MVNIGKTEWLIFAILKPLLGFYFALTGGVLVYNGFLAIKNKELILHPSLIIKKNCAVIVGVLFVLFGSFALFLFYGFLINLRVWPLA